MSEKITAGFDPVGSNKNANFVCFFATKSFCWIASKNASCNQFPLTTKHVKQAQWFGVLERARRSSSPTAEWLIFLSRFLLKHRRKTQRSITRSLARSLGASHGISYSIFFTFPASRWSTARTQNNRDTLDSDLTRHVECYFLFLLRKKKKCGKSQNTTDQGLYEKCCFQFDSRTNFYPVH